jgi:hypothetical protein
VYDYVDGKVDWMAYGLPVEGDDGPFLGSRLAEVTTCDVTARVADARRALDASGGDTVVLVHAGGMAVGEVDRGSIEGMAGDVDLLDILDPVPTTVRPSVTVASLAGAGGGERLVTTSDGRLLGVASVAADDDHDHDHDHDHVHAHGRDDGEEIDQERFDAEMAEVTRAVEERFGDQDPSAGELRAFLHERLVAEGRTAEEADHFLDQLEIDEDE